MAPIGDNVFAGMGAAVSDTASGVTEAYGPSAASGGAAPGIAAYFHPGSGFGLAFWLGIGGVAALVLIYRSLPG